MVKKPCILKFESYFEAQDFSSTFSFSGVGLNFNPRDLESVLTAGEAASN